MLMTDDQHRGWTCSTRVTAGKWGRQLLLPPLSLRLLLFDPMMPFCLLGLFKITPILSSLGSLRAYPCQRNFQNLLELSRTF